MDEVQKIDSDNVEIFGCHEVDENDKNYLKELDSQIEYLVTVERQLNEISLKFRDENESQCNEKTK